MTGTARFYYNDRAGILGYVITAEKAEQIFAARDCVGDLERGFCYWGSGAGVPQLVHIAVTPLADDQVPLSACVGLGSGADQVCGFCGSVERFRVGRNESGG